MAAEPTRIRRLPERGTTDRATIDAILDEGFVCHVAYVIDHRPVIIPTLYARDEDRIILHGSTSSGITRAVRRGSPLSIAVTHVDGIVVARSGFHSSANYRSVVVHGQGTLLEGEDHRHALDLTINALIPGRLGDVRGHTDLELRQTATIAVPLDQVSAKVRVGPPKDDPEDIPTDTWAGVVPMSLIPGLPEAAPDLLPGIEIPDYLKPYKRSPRDT